MNDWLSAKAAVAVAAALLAVFFVIRALMRRHDRLALGTLEHWISLQVEAALSERLGRPISIPIVTPDEVATLTSTAIQFSLDRKDPERRCEISVIFSFRDGGAMRRSTTRTWEELPAVVRSEFLRNGQSAFTRPWTFPTLSREASAR